MDLRFGFHSGQQFTHVDEAVAAAQRVEAMGMSWMSIFDHWRPVLGGPDGPCLDATVTLAAIAMRTSRIAVALMVTPAHMHNPGLLAMRAIALQQISQGRFVLGVGAGGADDAHSRFGLAHPPPAMRVAAVEDLLSVLRRMMHGEEVTHSATFFRLSNALVRPPLGGQTLDIVVGAQGRRMLDIAGRYADIWNRGHRSVEHYVTCLAQVRAAAERFGRNPDSVRPSLTFRTVIGDASHCADVRSQLLTRQGPHAPDLNEYVSWGTAEQCAQALRPYVDAGVKDLVLAMRPPVDWATTEKFVEQVVPMLREGNP